MATKERTNIPVVATAPGVYGSKRRRQGSEFTIVREGHFDPNWMREVDKPKRETTAKSKPEKSDKPAVNPDEELV